MFKVVKRIMGLAVVGLILMAALILVWNYSGLKDGVSVEVKGKENKMIAIEKEGAINLVTFKNGINRLTDVKKLDVPQNTLIGWWTDQNQLVLLTNAEKVGDKPPFYRWKEFDGFLIYNPAKDDYVDIKLSKKVALVKLSPTKDRAMVLVDYKPDDGRSHYLDRIMRGDLTVLELDGNLIPVIKDNDKAKTILVENQMDDIEDVLWIDEGKQILLHDAMDNIYIGQVEKQHIQLECIFSAANDDQSKRVINPQWLSATGEIAFWYLDINKDEIILKAIKPKPNSEVRELLNTVPQHSGVSSNFCVAPKDRASMVIYVDSFQGDLSGTWLLNHKTKNAKKMPSYVYPVGNLENYFIKTPHVRMAGDRYPSKAELVKLNSAGDFELVVDLPGWVDFVWCDANEENIVMSQTNVYYREYEGLYGGYDVYFYDFDQGYIYTIDQDVEEVVW